MAEMIEELIDYEVPDQYIDHLKKQILSSFTADASNWARLFIEEIKRAYFEDWVYVEFNYGNKVYYYDKSYPPASHDIYSNKIVRAIVPKSTYEMYSSLLSLQKWDSVTDAKRKIDGKKYNSEEPKELILKLLIATNKIIVISRTSQSYTSRGEYSDDDKGDVCFAKTITDEKGKRHFEISQPEPSTYDMRGVIINYARQKFEKTSLLDEPEKNTARQKIKESFRRRVY